MKKELIFSFAGHTVIFLILIGVAKSKPKENLYPDVFQVSVINLESGIQKEESPCAVSVIEKKTVPVKKKEVKLKEKPTLKKTTGPKSGCDSQKTETNIGLKISSKGGKYSYYIDAVLTKIGSNWSNPFENSGIKFSATIYFVIKKDGQITSVKIEKSSGNELFDRSAERAVIVTKTLPPLAGEFSTQDSLRLHLEFEYKP